MVHLGVTTHNWKMLIPEEYFAFYSLCLQGALSLRRGRAQPHVARAWKKEALADSVQVMGGFREEGT